MNVPNLTEQQKEVILKSIFRLPSSLARFRRHFYDAIDLQTYINVMCDTAYSKDLLYDYRSKRIKLTPEQVDRCINSLPVDNVFVVLGTSCFTAEQKSKVIEKALKYKNGARALYREIPVQHLSQDVLKRLAKKIFSYTFNDEYFHSMYKSLLEYAKERNIQL
jgi:hypothetical protein